MLSYLQLVRNGKKPVKGPWQISSDPKEIAQWEGNLGLLTGAINGIVARDYDKAAGMELAREEYRTRREFFKCLVKTPSGGLHVYLRAPPYPVPNAVKIGGKPVDLRGERGFVVAVGSRVQGKVYEYLKGYEFRSVEELPEFPEFWLPPKKEVQVQTIEEVYSLRRITRARLWLQKAEPAVSGQSGHNKMFFACCRMFQMFELSMDQAWPLILEYNERAVPPFSTKELLHKLESAAQQKGE